MEYKILEAHYVGEQQVYPKNRYGNIGKWYQFWVVTCPVCGNPINLHTENLGGDPPFHTVEVKEGRVTVNPSIGCPHCKAHYFIRDGKIIPA
jgi:uncharacterized protein YbaR (Trm112 family)